MCLRRKYNAVRGSAVLLHIPQNSTQKFKDAAPQKQRCHVFQTTHTLHTFWCLFCFYDLGLYLWKRSEPPQGGHPHSLRNATFSIFLSHVLLDFRTRNLLTDVLNQSCLSDYHRGHSCYEVVFFFTFLVNAGGWGVFFKTGRILFIYNNEQTRIKWTERTQETQQGK